MPRGSADAYLLKKRLESEGIKAVIINENAPVTRNALIELQVRAKDVQQANEILKEAPGNSVKPIANKDLIFGLVMSAFFISLGILLITISQEPKWYGIFVIVLGSMQLIMSLYILNRRISIKQRISKSRIIQKG